MSLYVKYVASNAKGGVSCLLGPKTLITGPNGSGKSSVINAIELALGGFATDIAGRREVKKETELIALAPGRQGELFARAILSDNSEAKWSAGAKGAKKAVHVVPPSVIVDRVFPLLPVRDAVEGKPETARKFFISYALPNITKEDVLTRIPESLHKNYHDATLSAELSMSAIDRLLLALDYASKRAKDNKKKGKAQTEMAQVVTDGLAPLPTEEVVNAVKKAQRDAQKAVDDFERQRGAAAQIERTRAEAQPLQDQLAQAEQNVISLQQAVQQADTQLQATPAPAITDEHTARVIAMVNHLAQLEQQTTIAQVCPCCRTQTQFGTFQQRAQAAAVYRANEEAKAGPYQFLVQQRQQLQNNLVGWQTQVAALRTQLQAIHNSIAAGAVPPVDEAALATARQNLANANAEVTRLETIKVQWEQAKKAKEVASDTDKAADQWAELEDACSAAVAQLMDAGVAQFVGRVQSFLPSTDRFNLHLREQQKQVFRFGLQRGDVLHTALSGAEWARVMGAISGACAEADKLSVLIPEERAFDPVTLAATLAALTNVPGQIVIASPVAPTQVPVGWTVVDTTTGAHRSAVFSEAA